MENIAEQRWTEIVHKTTIDRQKLIYGKAFRAFLKLISIIFSIKFFVIFPGKVYKYAQSIAAQLSSHLKPEEDTLSRNYKNITLP